jgi:hypothetical protein
MLYECDIINSEYGPLIVDHTNKTTININKIIDDYLDDDITPKLNFAFLIPIAIAEIEIVIISVILIIIAVVEVLVRVVQ